MICTLFWLPLAMVAWSAQFPELDAASQLPSTQGAATPPGAAAAVELRQFAVRQPGVLTADIPGVLHATLTSTGLLARAGVDELGLQTVVPAVHGPTSAPQLGACAPTSEQVGGRCAPAAELGHGWLTEWWTSAADGVHQGWTLHAPPAGDPVATFSLHTTRGRLRAVDADGRGAWFEGDTGRAWRYDELRAWDADGRDVPVRLAEAGTELRIEVDGSRARWPITVDPVLSTELVLVASDNVDDARFGISVSSAGDIDGDGFDDVVVGASMSGGYGAAYVYYGSAGGIEIGSEQKVTPAASRFEIRRFGGAVAAAGDVNGDGFADLIVGAENTNEIGEAYEAGTAHILYGSRSGIADQDELMASDAESSDYFGARVAGAGDLNADGFDDVVVGVAYDDDQGDSSGAVYVYYGSPLGIDNRSEQKLTASDAVDDTRFGVRVSRAGDVNGDGFDDLLVGAAGDGGRAYLYFGAADGVDPASEERLMPAAGPARDCSPAVAGDVNGDGFSDLIVSGCADYPENPPVRIYYGAASGLSDVQDVIASPADTAAHWVTSVTGAGDLDGDGFDDVAIGDIDARTVYVYFGAAAGIDLGSAWEVPAPDGGWAFDSNRDFGRSVSGAGDVDADGYADLLVGSPFAGFTPDQLTGAAFVFMGGCPDRDRDGTCTADDCDDADATRYLGATEVIGDGVDQDCDGTELCLADADGDGTTAPASTLVSLDTDCSDPGEGSASDPTGDCDDSDPLTYPGAPEVADDGVDQDCDGADLKSDGGQAPRGGDDDDKSGCGCASSGTAPSSASILFLLISGVLGARRPR